MTTPSKAKEFLSRWRMNIVDSNRRVHTYHLPEFLKYNLSELYAPTVYETEVLHTIQISESALESLVDFYDRVEESMKYTGSMDVFNHYIKQQKDDKEFRQKYPAVQKAYDKYMTLYKLAKSGEKNGR